MRSMAILAAAHMLLLIGFLPWFVEPARAEAAPPILPANPIDFVYD